MNLYRQQKARQEKEINAFFHDNAFFAFNEQQYKDGLKKLGLKESGDELKIISIGAGGYLLTDKKGEYKELFNRIAEERKAAIEDDETGAQFAYDMFYYELNNHEYSYTGRTEDAISALGLSYSEIRENPRLKEALDKACKDVMADAV